MPEHVLSMVGDWNGLLVTSACPIPGRLVEALLRAGVKAIVAPGHRGCWANEMRGGPRSAILSHGAAIEADGDGETSQEAAVMLFFAAFYEALFSGAEVMGAIQAGEAAAPETVGLFQVHV